MNVHFAQHTLGTSSSGTIARSVASQLTRKHGHTVVSSGVNGGAPFTVVLNTHVPIAKSEIDNIKESARKLLTKPERVKASLAAASGALIPVIA